MIRFRCPSCQAMLQADESAVGLVVACPCGQEMTVPFQAAPASPQQQSPPVQKRAPTRAQQKKNASNTAPEALALPTTNDSTPSTVAGGTRGLSRADTQAPQSIILECQCGKYLRAPISAMGKAVRCACGQLVPVQKDVPKPPPSNAATPPSSQVASRAAPLPELSDIPVIPADAVRDWVDNLPPPKSVRVAGQGYWQSAPRAAYSEGEARHVQPIDKEVAAGKYMAKAEAAIDDQRRHRRSLGSDELSGASWLYMTVAIIGLAVWISMIVFSERLAEMAIERGGMRGDSEDVQLAIIIGASVFTFLNVITLFLGIFTPMFPLTCTITGLTLFSLVTLLHFLSFRGTWINPFFIAFIAMRIVLILAMVKSVNDAAYYR